MIFPPAPAVTVVLDGAVVHSYNAAYLAHGRVMAPLDPFLTGVAASIEYSAGTLIVRRSDRFAQVPMPQPVPSQFQSTYVEIAPVMRTLGIAVSYDARTRRLFVRTPRVVLATPTPFNPAVPQAPPSAVFTPVPQVTPRPAVTGKPAPRRTPLPFASPVPTSPTGSGRHRARRGA